MQPVSRRAFLAGLGITAATPVVWDPVRAGAQRRASLAAVTDPTGTTLEFSIRRPAGTGYLRLVEGDPYEQVVRSELAEPKAGREARRRPVASIVHLTDVHVVDAQSPSRVEFTDRIPPDGPFAGAFRPQETMSTQVASAMVQRVASVARGPVTGRPFDVAVSTGDNIDNQARNELAWFMALLDGGTVTPNSGDPDRYEGVQDDDEGLGYYNDYWHPDAPPGSNPADSYKVNYGFPELPGLLTAAIRSHESPGVGIRWYSSYGNHDGLLQGNAPGELPGDVAPFDPVSTGPIKITALAPSFDQTDITSIVSSLPGVVTDPAVLADGTLYREVTPDEDRAAATVEDWIRAHLDSPASPGPVGHGYSEDMIESRRLYYTFPISESVLGISLDTVNHGGYADGSVGDAQLVWLEQQLVAAHSRYFDAAGTTVETSSADRLVVLFSHHNLHSLENPFPDPFFPEDPRRGFEALRALLQRFPNVIAWVNGHSHVNRITPVPDPAGRTGGFWEVSTAAHIDWPEQARLVEIADNCDGTLSIFGTLIEHASPASVDLPDPSAATVEQLASLSRELSANDPQASMAALGAPGDRNVELLLAAPFSVCGTASTPPTTTGARTGGAPEGGTLAATGGGPGALVAGAALGAAAAGALALRRRTTPPPG